MFVSENITFVELHKTGGTHICKLLSEIVGGKQVGKHNYPNKYHLNSDRLFLGSIRNPLEWYLSLWSYGCDNKGGIFEKTTRSFSLRGFGLNELHKLPLMLFMEYLRKPSLWLDCYCDVNDVENFRKWLRMIFDKKHKYDFGEGYGTSRISNIAGLMTYRYLSLYVKNHEMILCSKKLTSHNDLLEFDSKYCYIDFFIRNEHLPLDLIKAIQLANIELKDDDIRLIMKGDRTNASSRKKGVEYYYDKASMDLVLKNDWFIFEKFDYQVKSKVE